MKPKNARQDRMLAAAEMAGVKASKRRLILLADILEVFEALDAEVEHVGVLKDQLDTPRPKPSYSGPSFGIDPAEVERFLKFHSRSVRRL